MKKLTVWAMLAMLIVAGSAFAATSRGGQIAANATFDDGGPATTNNDDSCDISVAPAATLLLPYFEVDLDDPTGETTLFTITNTSNLDAIAHVTLWTDYSFPVIDFNIYLTGYDVQPINLYDIIERGIIAPDAGTGTAITKRGTYSDANGALTLTACDRLPGPIDDAYVVRMQSAFTEGTVPDLGVLAGCNNVGNEHDNAVGYATIDVADLCSTSLPTDDVYFASEIRFDNVLIGDYQQVHSANNFAQGNPMVHIRAIPEGGDPLDPDPIINFDRTFYSRFQAGGVADRRQPLPSVFAARWIQGGTSDFQTSYKIWREGDTANGDRTCATWDDNVTNVAELVRFDQAEFAVGDVPVSRISPPITTEFTLPETSLTSVADSSIYPQLTNGAVGGWMYLNLDNSTTDSPLASQNWVVVSMRAEGRYSVDFDAAWLANGCTIQEPISEVTTGTEIIGPAVETNPNDLGPLNANWNPDQPYGGGNN
ncbi:MAG TPA: hypothetical protein VGQ36_17370 [Thermoanaerobaculia bacterium]|jgi:hypothetical protein|nr:hypothetical protein [Thermoanaerobaculia bacterium]